MSKAFASISLLLCWAGAVAAQDLVSQALQADLKGDFNGAREMMERVLLTNPDNVAYRRAYAEMLERHRSPRTASAYEALLETLKKTSAPEAEVARVGQRLQILAKLADTSPAPRFNNHPTTINIPGPLRSFARMSALSPDLSAEDLLPALARNVVTNGYQAAANNEALDQTEYLKLIFRYLSQARELEKLSGADKTIKIEQCESIQTGELLKVLGYRMRGGCGAEVVLETVNASRAFLTIDSGFPLAELEQALRTNKPFIYSYAPSAVPVLYGPEYWVSTVKEKPTEFIDLFLGDPLLCRMYLGLSKLDPVTAEELKKVMPAARIKAYAHVVDFFGGMFQIRNGRAVIPGGARSEKAWTELAGVSPEQGGQFFDRLISKDDGWLASFYDSLVRIQGPTREYLSDPDRMKRFYAAVRGRVTSPGPARPVFRANTDMMLLTTRLRLEPNGRPHIPGSIEVWKNLFVNHPHGKYDGKLTKSAAGWKEADDVLEALFGLTRKAVENEPLKIFMALSDLNRVREKPLEPATVDRLAREYRFYGAQYPVFAESSKLKDATLLAYLDTAHYVAGIKDQLLRADVAGSLQALVGLWQLLVRQGMIESDGADAALNNLVTAFAKVKNARELFETGRDQTKAVLVAAKANPKLNYQERMMDLLAGVRGDQESDTQLLLIQDMIRIFESQRLISLQTIFELDENLETVAKGGKLNSALVKRLAARVAEVTLPRQALSSQEKNSLAFGYWTEKHVDNQRKLNLPALVDKAANDPEKIKDLRANLAPLLRDTLVGFLYVYYAPPAAQILMTNPVFVRSHDFIGLQGSNQTWKQTEVFGTGWPSSAGGRLVGSLAGLPYALAEAEQNFLVPTREQALIWGDLVPQMILTAVVPRWWQVTPAQLHWVSLHMNYGETLVAAAALDPAKRAPLLALLDKQAPPARTRRVETLLASGHARAALDQIVPAELFALAHEMSAQDQADPLAAAIRRLSQEMPEANLRAIAKAFGTPKPTLANSYQLDLMQLRTFPTLMGYSSRIMAETWESNLLYYAALADEVRMAPEQLNLAVKDWTRQTVERIFATHLEDWPALLRSLRTVGDDVRERARKQLPLMRGDGGGN
jgi:urease accessory protein UreF